MSSRLSTIAFVLLALGLLGSGDACFKKVNRDGDGGGDPPIIDNPDLRCAPLPGEIPPALAFEPDGAPLWVVDSSSSTLLPFDPDVVPPVETDPGPFVIPADSDGDGDDDVPSPILDEINMLGTPIPDLGQFSLVTATAYDVVLLFRPDLGALFPLFPGLAMATCLRPPPGARDSLGEEVAPSPCDDTVPSYDSASTSGTAFIADKLFVSMANPGVGAGTVEPQFLPGAVQVYSLAIDGVAPDPDNAVIFTQGFNPTHVTPWSTETRNFVLVTVSGAIGTVGDNPATPDVEEMGFVALTDAAIEVIEIIDVETVQLVATIPLGRAALAGGLVVDPSGRIGVLGSAVGRWLLAVDLEPLATLDISDPGSLPIELDDAVIFDATNPLQLPARTDGGAAKACSGITSGVAFNDAGDRIYATDFCDGTLSVVDVDLFGANPTFTFSELITLTAPIDTADATAPRGPGAIAVRPGTPNTSFTGPDVFVLVGQPDGLLCAIDVESVPEPALP